VGSAVCLLILHLKRACRELTAIPVACWLLPEPAPRTQPTFSSSWTCTSKCQWVRSLPSSSFSLLNVSASDLLVRRLSSVYSRFTPASPGMLQNLLVTPPAMYWPAILVTVQLFTTLYSHTSSALSRTAQLLTRQRLRVFMLVFLVTFLYQFLPLLLFPTLTSVSVLCLMNNRSWWMRTLGSGYNGLGVGDLSLDWSSVGSSGPLYTPFWALGNYFGGLVGMCWVVG